MFVSKYRPVVYPQFEHARLAGAIAQHWGNKMFRQPDLPFDAFCAGVALHDFGYGLLDTHDILGMKATERRLTFESLLRMHFNDTIVEVVAKTHVARLMHMSELTDLEEKCRQDLKGLIARSGIPEKAFREADTITRLCDSIAFDFCFEQAATGIVSVLAEHEPCNRVEVRYEIEFRSDDSPNGAYSTVGRIKLMPWPLSCETVRGYLFAYEQSGYPDVLNPQRVGFELCPG